MPPKLESCVSQVMDQDWAKKRWPDEKTRRSHAYAICNASIEADESHLYYFTEIKGAPEWIHILPVTKVEHPVYGTIDITPERVQRFAKNVNDKVRGIVPSINYEHSKGPDGGRAAGWIMAAEARDDGLWGKIHWTPRAKQEVESGEWRYISGELLSKWKDPESGTSHNDVLAGAALTNRPFMRKMVPLNFEDIPDEAFPKEGGAEDYDPYKFADDYVVVDGYVLPKGVELRDISESERKKHPASDFAGEGTSFPIFECNDVGAAWIRRNTSDQDSAKLARNIISIAKRKGFTRCLPETAKSKLEEVTKLEVKELAELLGVEEDKVLETVKTLKESNGDSMKGLSELLGVDNDKVEETIKTLKEEHDAREKDKERKTKFAEEYPEEAQRLEEQSKQLTEMQKATLLSEVKEKVANWERPSGKRKHGLAPKFREPIQKIALELSEDERSQLFGLIEDIVETGFVDFSTRGNDDEPTVIADEAEQFIKEVERYQEENKDTDYADAVEAVGKARPELARAYNDARPKFSGRQGGGE